MASTTRINITARPKKSETITLLGKQYSVRPPKTALLMALQRHNADADDPGAVVRDFDTIVKLLFGTKAPEIQKRLDDPEDDLDIDHIFEIVEALTAQVAGNPTS